MLNQAAIECRVFHPTQQAPDAPSNVVLEGFVREVISQTALADLQMRFFGNPVIEAIAGRITGRIPDQYEQPRDCVIVAFEKRKPVGYIDAIRFSEQMDQAFSQARSQGIWASCLKQPIAGSGMSCGVFQEWSDCAAS